MIVRSRRLLMLGAALVVAFAVVAAGCGSSEEAKVEQEIHDDVVAAYDETVALFASAEGKVERGSEAVWAEAKSDFAAIEADLDAAKDYVGKEAIVAYRDIQHELNRLGVEADGVLHTVGHTVSNASESVWHELKQAYREVHNAVDHAVDDLHS